jgi:menaquinone-dependent protoporphyrinogen oxidase
MNVLVAYASAYGSTKGIAIALAEVLRDEGLVVDLRPMDEVSSLAEFGAVVLGSAIHGGTWLPPAAAFIEEHADELAQRPVWLFSVSSVGDTSSVFGRRVADAMRRMRSEPAQITKWRTQWSMRGHRNFAGVVERSHWGLVGTVFIRALGGTYGDHRDWRDIRRWAGEIASALAD